jgi:fusion and transport protein UGO1
MLRRLRNTPSESLPSLWKSQLITTTHSLLSNLLQPHIHTALLSLSSSPTLSNIPLTALPSPLIPLTFQVTAHFLTHWILSPFEIIRTRLISMPTSHPSTPSSITLFKRMIKDEGGFSTLYLHPNLLFPTILEHTLRPVLALSIPLLLERQFQLTPETSPITYAAADLSLGLASLVVLLPIETIRKRLQLQHRGHGGGSGKRGKSIVKLRERDYVGVVEGIWRIVTEETGVRRKRVMTEKDEGGVFSGIRQLYRGVSYAATPHLSFPPSPRRTYLYPIRSLGYPSTRIIN